MSIFIKNMTPKEFAAYGQDCAYRVALGSVIELPKHGRLIDADALYELFVKMAKKSEGLGALMVGMAAECIKYAPTIIPAEDEE